jgi:hypothetical protein
MLPDLQNILEALVSQGVDFVIIGGMAAVAQGVPITTFDLDICYRRTAENHRKLVAALKPFKPALRAPGEPVPFVWDEKTLELGCNFTLSTTAGDLDILGELLGGITYDDVLAGATVLGLFGHPVKVMGLRDIIRTKEALRRPKDAAALEILRETLRLQDEKKAEDRGN